MYINAFKGKVSISSVYFLFLWRFGLELAFSKENTKESLAAAVLREEIAIGKQKINL
jgi:hypothetical protein